MTEEEIDELLQDAIEIVFRVDVLSVKLKLNDDVWGTEILWSALKNRSISNDNNWVIGGDFNSSETFDYLWKGGARGNREIIERMNNLGLKECLRSFNGELTPTFRNPKGGNVIHQMDHLYVSEEIFTTLSHCATGDSKRIFDQSLSDHLPIIADFE
jgi:endonuclease/exonuclease/phosphatase family metal-dependent hydrolase